MKHGAAVNAETARISLDAAGDTGKEPIPRRMYIAMRLSEISVSIQTMAKEREALTAELKVSPDDAGVNHRELRQRRAYVAQRLQILRREQADLKVEKTDLISQEPAPL